MIEVTLLDRRQFSAVYRGAGLQFGVEGGLNPFEHGCGLNNVPRYLICGGGGYVPAAPEPAFNMKQRAWLDSESGPI